jgi:maltooligosyltrehalose synthase
MPGTARTPDLTDASRTRALVQGVESLIAKLADPDARMPLDLIDRYERALAAGHRSNLLRLSAIEDRCLAQREAD